MSDDFEPSVALFLSQAVTFEAIAHAQSKGDPLGIADLDEDDVEARLIAALEGGLEREARVRVAKDIMRISHQVDGGDPPLTEMVADVMAHEGVDPLVVAWLAAVCGYLEINRDNDLSVIAVVEWQTPGGEPPDADAEATFETDDLVVWARPCSIRLPIPHATALAAVGRRLGKIVEHPALTRHGDLRVTGLAEHEDGEATLSLEARPRATVEHLLSLHTRRNEP